MDSREHKNWSGIGSRIDLSPRPLRNNNKIISLQNDVTQSWVVISKGMNKYITEMPEGNEEFLDNVGANATNSTPVQHQASSSSMKATLPFGQRHWITSLVLNRADWDYDSSAYWLSKTVCRILRQKTNFEKLTEQSNGKHCALSMVARSPRWTSVIGPRMNGLNI